MPSEDLTLDGKTYSTYVEYVAAKRQRNQEILLKSGLLEAKHVISTSFEKTKNPKPTKKFQPQHKAIRLSSDTVEDVVMENKTDQGTEVSGLDVVPPLKPKKKRKYVKKPVKQSPPKLTDEGMEESKKPKKKRNSIKKENLLKNPPLVIKKHPPKEKYYGNRINDGSDLSITEAACTENAISFCKTIPIRPHNPKSVVTCEKTLIKKMNALQINETVRIVPECVYSTTFHPNVLIACAGDKSGYLGLWKIDSDDTEKGNSDNDNISTSVPCTEKDKKGVTIFQPHSNIISCLEWNNDGSALYSLSQDNTIRALDINTQSFQTLFATYNSDSFQNKPGYYPDDGSTIHYGTLHENGYFLSTSNGKILHLDVRTKQVTSCHTVDKQSINTLSVHKDGYSMVIAGQNRKIQLFDIRKMPNPIASRTFSQNVQTAFFSPSGTHLLTTINDTIDLYKDFHLKTSNFISPDQRISHWQTGARWHPTEDVFCTGGRGCAMFDSNEKVRSVKVDGTFGSCCFAGGEEMVVFGGGTCGKAFLLRK